MSPIREFTALSKRKTMNAVVEAKSMLRAIPRGVDQQKSDWLRVAARIFGLTFSQAKKIEYLEVQDMRASRLDAMRATFTELQERAAKRGELLNDLTEKLAAARSSYGSGNPVPSGPRPESLGRRGDGAGEGSLRENRPTIATVRQT